MGSAKIIDMIMIVLINLNGENVSVVEQVGNWVAGLVWPELQAVYAYRLVH